METLVERFFPIDTHHGDPALRERYGMLSGWVGVGVNLLLFAAKLAIGLLSGAISIVADALNNLSDAGSAIVMMLGFRFASRPADSEHPFGHGRIEYLTGLFVAVVILVVGVQLLQSSIEKILHPIAMEISLVTGGVLLLSILGKLVLAAFYQLLGDRIQSEAIQAAAADSRSDCLATSVVLLSLVVYDQFGWNIDGAAGVIVSLFILYSGWEAVKSTAHPLVGEAPDPDLVSEIKQEVLANPPIIGVHDLIVHNYGPGQVFASLHAEVPGDMEIMEAHAIIDDLERRLVERFHINVTVHMDPIIIDDPETNRLRLLVGNIVRAVDPTLTMHDFRLTTAADGGLNLLFEVVVPPECRLDDQRICQTITEQLARIDARYIAGIYLDHHCF